MARNTNVRDPIRGDYPQPKVKQPDWKPKYLPQQPLPDTSDAKKREDLSQEFQQRYQQFAPQPITSVSQTGPEELQKTLAMRESALQGYQAPELEAMRSQIAAGQQAAQQQRERALQAALAKQGIRGGSAAALQAQQAQLAAREKAGMDTEMMLRQAERQRQALGEYETGVTSAYNLEQRQRFAQLANKLAAEQAAQAELGGQRGLKEAGLYSEAQKQIAEAAGGGGCCFIFLEANNGVLDRIARKSRDELMTNKNRRGYYKLSEVLVPLMRKYPVVKFLVNWTMVKPMISAGKWKYKENKIGKIFAPVAYFWLGLFDYLGSDHSFQRENGEIV